MSRLLGSTMVVGRIAGTTTGKNYHFEDLE